MPDLRVAYAEWRDDPDLQQRWIRWVLDELLGSGTRSPRRPRRPVPPRRRARGDAARLLRRARPHPRRHPGGLLVHRLDAGTRLPAAPRRGWASSPIDRAAELARASGVRSRSSPTGRAGRSSGRARARAPGSAPGAASCGSRSRSHSRVRHAARRPAILLPPRRGGAGSAARGERRQTTGGRRPARRPGPPRGGTADRDARPRGPRAPRRAARRTRVAPRCTAARSQR